MKRQASRLAVMHTVPTVQFPESVFKAQGIYQVAYAHPRDVKADGCILRVWLYARLSI